MKAFLFLLLFAAAASSASAQNVYTSGSNDEAAFLADADTRRRNSAGNVQIWAFIVFKEPVIISGRRSEDRVYSNYYEIDCQSNRHRSLQGTAFTADQVVTSMFLTSPDSWSYTEPSSVMSEIHTLACTGVPHPNHFKVVGSLWDAARFMMRIWELEDAAGN